MMRAGVLLAAFLLLAPGAAAAETVPEPPGYRLGDYKAPTPATLAGARVVTTAEAEALWRDGVTFVDVLGQPPRPELPEGTVWNPPPRFDIPGSVWLPDVGRGALPPEMEAWYGEKLAALTGGDKGRALVLYCKAECWMSWNAAKRAIGWGYGGVHWYPDGTDGWEAAALPLEERTAEKRPGEVR